jgi:radical SAM superfamily enzyme YgiQ (UPF0313 family)
MKILFTHAYFLEEDAKEKEIMKPYVPLGILYLSAWLEKHGYPNQLFDSTFSSFDTLKEYLMSFRPDAIGIYTNLMTKLNVLRLVQFIKATPELSHTKVILGGPEVRNHAQPFLEHGADFIVIGEGEQTMQELVEYLDGKSERSLDQIQGIAYLDSQKAFKQTAERAKLKDLDQLPIPNRKGINLQLYFDAWKGKHGSSAISINTMRGCPYSCKWCSKAVYGQSYRRRSPEHVVNEIEDIQRNYQVDTIWFVDDVFTVSHQWLKRFDEVLRERNVKISYECISRSDRMDENVIALLKSSGCFRVWIGAESGSQKIIDKMDRRVDVIQVREMIRQTRKAGIQAGTFIMVGYPDETEADIIETSRHLKESNPDYFTITVTYPITGTGLYQEAEPEFFKLLPWEKRTDRDINFKRTYPRRYYDYAIRFLISELDAHKAFEKRDFLRYLRLKYRVLKARAGMLICRLKGLNDPNTVKPSKEIPVAKPDRSKPASLKQVQQA